MPKQMRLLIIGLAFGAAASQAQAATYYVRNGGDDSADGRSHATAWATIEKVNGHSLSAGDSVLFHDGGTWKGKALSVGWSGTDKTHAVVGAYYVDNGTPRRGYRAARPTIDGGDRIPGEHDGLIQVRGDRVRIENLAVVNSEGRGVNFHEVRFGQAAGLLVDNIYSCGIAFIRAHDGLAEGNIVRETDRQRYEDGKNWCAAIATVASDRTVIRSNRVEKVYGEGINANHNSADALIEDNFVFAARAVGIYADAAPRPTIRRNLVVGTANPRYWRYERVSGGGIVLSNERYHYKGHGGSLSTDVQTRQARVHGNLVAYSNQGIALWGELEGSTFDNTLIYNNTLVDNEAQLRTQGRPLPGSVLANNIMLSITPGTRDAAGDFRGVTVRNNYFSQGDPGGALAHASNRFSGLRLARMTGWRTITDPSNVSWRDFMPLETSATNGAGDAGHLASAKPTDALALDFNRHQFGTPPDIGGLSTKPRKVPKSPGAVGVTVR